MVIPI